MSSFLSSCSLAPSSLFLWACSGSGKSTMVHAAGTWGRQRATRHYGTKSPLIPTIPHKGLLYTKNNWIRKWGSNSKIHFSQGGIGSRCESQDSNSEPRFFILHWAGLATALFQVVSDTKFCVSTNGGKGPIWAYRLGWWDWTNKTSEWIDLYLVL